MNSPALVTLIQRIHDARIPAVIEYAGAGSQALWWLHSVAGSSRTILEATDRYSQASMTSLLRERPAQFVSQATAIAMAKAAYERAMDLSTNQRVIGVSCTATIATDYTKKGNHGCWVAIWDERGCTSHGLVLHKGSRDRSGEEAVISQLLIEALAMCQGLIDAFRLDLQPEERVDSQVMAHRDALGELLNGTHELLQYQPPSDFVPAHLQGVTVLSGSFNPLHDGHRDLLATAVAHTGQPGIYELSVVNVDKPTLPYSVIQRRAAQFATHGTLVISRAPRFLDKARLMPKSTFVLGYDTVIRLLDAKYYPDGDVADTLRQFSMHEVRFIVAGRVDKHGQFRLFDTTSVPSTWRHLFVALDEATFRRDVSSTSIRAQQVN